MSKIKVYRASKKHFIAFADQFKSPTPLRRTLSIMRMSGCKTIVHEIDNWESCNKKKNCNPRLKSCMEYRDKLSHYDCELIDKDCHKLFFFEKDFGEGEVEANIDSLLGFCIVHVDKLTTPDGEISHAYVTESIISVPFKRRGVIFGDKEYKFHVDRIPFSVTGNYFSQQNSITNSCAHAAIKMAVKGYHPDISAEEINDLFEDIHKNKEGYLGLKPKQIIQAVKQLTNLNTFHHATGRETPPIEFLKLVYHALESRLPVILLFCLPPELNGTDFNFGPVKDIEKVQNGDNDESGHAVTLTGYTINKHNWWSYALMKYFAIGEEVPYLPSFLWCDNFVIQDDNFGPHYLLPIRFLTDFACIKENIATLQSIYKSITSYGNTALDKLWLSRPMIAIVVCPDELKFLEHTADAELRASNILYTYIKAIKSDTKAAKQFERLEKNDIFNKYFYQFFKNNSLILRTCVIEKGEYINSVKDQIGDEIIAEVDSFIPSKKLWIVEISIPELFWVNRQKVGEIIVDPEKYKKNTKDKLIDSGVVFIRLPSLVSFHDGISHRTHIFNLDRRAEDDFKLVDLVEPLGLVSAKPE